MLTRAEMSRLLGLFLLADLGVFYAFGLWRSNDNVVDPVLASSPVPSSSPYPSATSSVVPTHELLLTPTKETSLVLPLVSSTPTREATSTPEPKPFTLGEIDLQQDLVMTFSDGITATIHPLSNLLPDRISTVLISQFQEKIKTDEQTRRSVLGLPTDLPGVTWWIGHSGVIDNVPLPWDWLAKADLVELTTNRPHIYPHQTTTEVLELLYAVDVPWEVTSFNVSPGNYGQGANGAFARTDKMGIPEAVRQELSRNGGLIVVTCEGDFVPTIVSTTGRYHYASQRISVWSLLP